MCPSTAEINWEWDENDEVYCDHARPCAIELGALRKIRSIKQDSSEGEDN